MLDHKNQNHQIGTETQMLFVMRILALALASSICMFGVILFSRVGWSLDSDAFLVQLRTPKGGLLMGLGVLMLVLRVPLSNLIFKGQLSSINVTDSKALLQAYHAPFILRIALAESCALMGFLSSYFAQEPTSFFVLGTCGLLAVLREFPSLERIQLIAQALKS